MKMINGTMVVLSDGNKLEDILNIFIPTTDTRKAIEYCNGNGEYLASYPIAIDLDAQEDYIKETIVDRLIELC